MTESLKTKQLVKFLYETERDGDCRTCTHYIILGRAHMSDSEFESPIITVVVPDYTRIPLETIKAKLLELLELCWANDKREVVVQEHR